MDDVKEYAVYGDLFYIFSSHKDYLDWCTSRDRSCIALTCFVDIKDNAPLFRLTGNRYVSH
jgi:hypothetical protein